MTDKQYLRFKRENKTFFIQCFPNERIETLKGKLQEFLDIDPNDMRLYIGSRLIDDKSTVFDQDMKNDSIIKVLIKKAGLGGIVEWEVLEEEKPPEGEGAGPN